MSTRGVFVWLHRYVGLAIAGFMIVAGLSGSAIAFKEELDAWLNPGLLRTASAGPFLTTPDLIARIEQADPRIQVVYAPLLFEPGDAALFAAQPRPDPATGRPFAVDYNQIFVDPTDGRILGTRDYGALAFDAKHLMPVLMRLHATMLWPGFGLRLMGIVALLWLFNCLNGLYLTLPRGRLRWAGWKPAWQIRLPTDARRLSLDLHRAAGLWFWALLLILAATSVSMSLRNEIVKPLVSLVSTVTPTPFDTRGTAPRTSTAASISMTRAIAVAQADAAARGWDAPARSIFHAANIGVYRVMFRASEDNIGGLDTRFIYVSGADGAVLDATSPAARSFGDVVLELQYPLHSGQIAGLPGRIAISLTGLVVALLAASGVVFWWKRRSWRWRRSAGCEPATSAPPRAAGGR